MTAQRAYACQGCGTNDLTNKNPRPKLGVPFSEVDITSAGRLVGRPVRASDSAAGSADQASAGRLVGHHPGRLAGSARRPDFDYSQS
jgi:hypothetical protein